MMEILLPRAQFQPLLWVTDILFNLFWGLPYRAAPWDGATVVIKNGNRVLSLSSAFPRFALEAPWQSDAVPERPAATLSPSELAEFEGRSSSRPALPFVFGESRIEASETRVECGLDILGSAFFLLSRFEEVARPDRDNHDRFPGAASLAQRSGMLQRPWVDELAEFMFSLMRRLWPSLPRPVRRGSVAVSCDVDHPYDASARIPALLLRTLAADVLSRRDMALAVRRLRNAFASAAGSMRHDPYDTFDWYLSALQRAGRKAAFYFIADHTAGHVDGRYDIYEPRVADVFRRVAGQGHEIGLHGSYNSYKDGPQLARERSRLGKAIEMAGIDQAILGNRQHVLRWSTAETPDHLDAAGFSYDTTGAFADCAGFRYGTSRAFPMWSWRRRGPLRIEQKPLIVMETTVIAKRYMGLGYSAAAFDLMWRLRQECEKYGGDFTLLWHNSHLTRAEDREFFEQLIQ